VFTPLEFLSYSDCTVAVALTACATSHFDDLSANGARKRRRITILEIFRSLRKLSDRHPAWMQHLPKDILTTKITKATKVWIFMIENFLCPLWLTFFLRELRVLRGEFSSLV
jgi:hypothetical protein